jgi:CRP/FNR family transcriptional regulator, cyclic AMP receptor protein
MSQTCLDCARRSDRVFCDLPHDALLEFEEIRSLQTFPRGSILFREGQPARAVFVLCDGRARLSVCSDDGRRLTVRTVPAGEVLGLSAALAGGLYEVTAEVMDTVQVAEVRRNKLLHFLRAHRDVCMQVVNTLSQDLHLAYARVRTVGLGRTRHHHPHVPAPQLPQ